MSSWFGPVLVALGAALIATGCVNFTWLRATQFENHRGYVALTLVPLVLGLLLLIVRVVAFLRPPADKQHSPEPSYIAAFVRDARESGLWFVLVLLLLIGTGVGVLDVIHWDGELAKGILAESNAVLMDIFLLGIVIALYEYRRKRHEEVRDLHKELSQLRNWNAPEGILRKVQLVGDLAAKGQKPATLRFYDLREASLNGYCLSGIDMRFVVLVHAFMVRTELVASDLFCADFSDSVLVEANLTNAKLGEANFSGALLSGAILAGADVNNADFRGARELTREQLTSASNWQKAYRDPVLACGAGIPQPDKKPLGNTIREQLRARGNPTAPYRLVTFVHLDGRTETQAEEEDGN